MHISVTFEIIEKNKELLNHLDTLRFLYTSIKLYLPILQTLFLIPGMNRKVTYGIEGNDIFLMDRQTGILSVTQSLDREKQAMYNLTVIAKDHGTPQLSARTNILVLVSGKSEMVISVN